MGLSKVKTSTELRENLSEALNDITKGKLLIVSHKSGNVVLISENQYDSLLNNLENLREIALSISELDSGKGIEHSKALAKIGLMKKKLKS